MTDDALPQLPVAAVRLVVTLSGAGVLALFDVWLRRKDVKDPAFVWLYLSLLSWSASSLLQLLVPQSVGADARSRIIELIPYILSPVSSALFTITAFRLARVREVFQRHDLRMWPAAVVAFVLALSLVAEALTLMGHGAGRTTDAIASSVALAALGAALCYSFHRYGNPYLVGLTGVTITWLIPQQFISADQGQLSGVLAALGVAGNATLTMLFVALAVAWGLSDASRMRPVGVPGHVNVVAMFFDLRGATEWSLDVLRWDVQYVGSFIDQLRAWAWCQAAARPCRRPRLVKFLGDGYLFVWEVPTGASPVDHASEVVRLGCALVQTYPKWTAENRRLWRGVPGYLGVGIDAGPAIRLTFENGSEDYVGAPLNTASKMQDLARPCGGMVVSGEVWRWLDPALQELLPKAATLPLGSGEPLEARATIEVESCEAVAL